MWHLGPMPKYFFKTHGAQNLNDDEGIDFPDADAARLEAVKFVGTCLNDRPYLLSESRDLRVELRDEDGEFVSMITVFVTNDPARQPDPHR